LSIYILILYIYIRNKIIYRKDYKTVKLYIRRNYNKLVVVSNFYDYKAINITDASNPDFGIWSKEFGLGLGELY